MLSVSVYEWYGINCREKWW